MPQLGNQLITKLLADDLTRTEVKHVKGVFTAERNYKIACRLYYHFNMKGLRYDVAIERLHNEFNLSETRLAQIVMEQAPVLKELKEGKTGAKELQRLFPYFNWN